VRFSADAARGFVEVWAGMPGRRMRPVLGRVRMQTLSRTRTGRAVPSNARIGIYRDPAIKGVAHLYYDGYTVATDRTAAEANAFYRPLKG
jgi:hypothetical protein